MMTLHMTYRDTPHCLQVAFEDIRGVYDMLSAQGGPERQTMKDLLAFHACNYSSNIPKGAANRIYFSGYSKRSAVIS